MPPGLRTVAALAFAVLTLAGCADPSSSAQRKPHGTATSADTPSALPSSAPSTPASTVVPWVDRPAPLFHWPPKPKRPPHDARPCRASELAAAPGGTGIGLGNINFRVDLTVRAETPCLLDGYPTLVGVTAYGVAVILHPRHGSYFGDPGPAANTRRGEVAGVNISSNDVCGHADVPRFTRYRIGLPHGGGWIEVRPGGFRLMCHSLSVSRFGVPADKVEAEDVMSPLTLRITAPHTMRAGTTLDYTVTIRNGSSRAYPLRPCPGYEEYLYAADQLAEGDFQLNCDTVTAIPARGSVRYAMRLALPASIVPGPVLKFGWQLKVPGEPAAAMAGEEVTA